MMPDQERNEPKDTIRYYRSFGDERPPVDDLRDILGRLEASGPEHLGATLVKGEACLDLASAEPDGAHMWVNRAEEALSEVDQRASVLQVRAYTDEFARRASLIVSAGLRRAELINWRRAQQGLPLLNNYRSLLQTSRDALPLMGLGRPGNEDKVKTTLVEAVPIILFARRRWLRSEGLLARLGLAREGRRGPLRDRNYNPNWDVGLYPAHDPAAFLRPTVKLEVKKRFPEGSRGRHGDRYGTRWQASAYSAAGVVPISANKFGFGNPRLIIESCLEELQLGRLSAEQASTRLLLPGGRLDSITRALQHEIRLHETDGGFSG